MVYTTATNNINVLATATNNIVLKQRIIEECRAISPETFERVQEFQNRMFYCQEVDKNNFKLKIMMVE